MHLKSTNKKQGKKPKWSLMKSLDTISDGKGGKYKLIRI